MAPLTPAEIQQQYIDSLHPKKPWFASLPSFGFVALLVGGAAAALWHFTKGREQ